IKFAFSTSFLSHDSAVPYYLSYLKGTAIVKGQTAELRVHCNVKKPCTCEGVSASGDPWRSLPSKLDATVLYNQNKLSCFQSPSRP
ncbi:hypothetical protein A6R68_19396, partial [Neotoma lepida]